MLSVSDVLTYHFCKRKLFLGKILGVAIKEPRKVPFAGSIKHKVIEYVVNHEEAMVSEITATSEHIEELYKHLFAKAIRLILLQEKKTLAVLGMELGKVYQEYIIQFSLLIEEKTVLLLGLIQKYQVYGKELWEKLPKIKAEYAVISSELALRGIIDELFFVDSLIIPYELKTGAAPKEGVYEQHQLQFALYILLLQEQYPQIDYGYVHYLQSNEKRKVQLNPFLKQAVLELLMSTKLLLEKKVLPPYCENKNKCNTCELKQYCYDESFMQQKMDSLYSIRKI